mgnify:CR=1 FL=1
MDILQTILDLDKAAAAQTELAVEQERRALKELEDKRLRRREKRVAEEQEKLDSLRSDNERMLNDKKDSADKALADKTSELDSIFAQHREEWQSEIISRITGV